MRPWLSVAARTPSRLILSRPVLAFRPCTRPMASSSPRPSTDALAPPLPHESFPEHASPHVLDTLKQYSTCEVSDGLLALDVKSGGFLPDLKLYSPSLSSTQKPFRLAGPVFTVLNVPYTDTTSPRPATHFVDSCPPGSILLISNPPSIPSATWGGLMSTGALAQGIQGVVVLGRVRDVAEHKEVGFPVFGRGQSTLGQTPFTRPSVYGGEISIEAAHLEGGEWVVNPSDLIVADEEGVVAVPLALVEELLGVLAKKREVDELCRKDLSEGRGVKETFKLRRH